MTHPSPTITLYLDTRRAFIDGRYPVKLRVTFQRKRRYYGLGVALDVKDYDTLTQGTVRSSDHKRIRARLDFFLQRAKSIASDLHVFHFEDFERAFKRPDEASLDVCAAMDRLADRRKEQDRLRTAESYQSAARSFRGFLADTGRKVLLFPQVDKVLLEDYCQWMQQRGRSLSTAGIYLRSLRVAFHQAMEDGRIEDRQYPFGRGRFVIPAARKAQKALSLEQVGRIYMYACDDPMDAWARDLWLFSYLCKGINPADMANLQRDQVQDGVLYFSRSKTADRKPQQKGVALTALALELLEKHRQSGNYIFGVLRPGLSAADELRAIRAFTRKLNRHLRPIGEDLKLPIPLTMYTARHTYASVLLRAGAPLAYIQESLGHSQPQTTQHYLAGFGQDTDKQYENLLTAFASATHTT